MGNMVAAAIFVCLAIAGAIFFVVYPGPLFVWYLLVKPVVDGFLEQGASIGGVTVSFSYLPSLVMPTMLLAVSMFHAGRFRHLPFKGLIIFYYVLNVIAYFREGHYGIGTTGYYIRVIFPVFLYFGVPLFVEGRAALEKLTKIAAISGIFPCGMIFLQRLGFIRYNRAAEKLGDVVYERATGGYSDSFSVALPIIIAIFFLLQIIQTNKEEGKYQKIWEILLGGYLLSLIFTFHRMTFVVIFVVLCMWIFLNRRIGYALVLGGLGLFFFSTLSVFVPDFLGQVDIIADTGNSIYANSDKAIALEGSALHGRGRLWSFFLNAYANASFLDQVLGIKLPGRAPHNDYIRVLFTVGAFGLIVYLFMLTLIGAKMLSIMRYYEKAGDIFFKNFAQTCLFMFVFYILSGMTLTISTLSTMSWYFWFLFGIIGYQHSLVLDAQRKELRQSFVFS